LEYFRKSANNKSIVLCKNCIVGFFQCGHILGHASVLAHILNVCFYTPNLPFHKSLL
uniref:Uncharacterized protein n=1 Tax=Cyprinus carpio TaxID=7962 RepID=A0A8C1WX82_CYPCA